MLGSILWVPYRELGVLSENYETAWLLSVNRCTIERISADQRTNDTAAAEAAAAAAAAEVAMAVADRINSSFIRVDFERSIFCKPVALKVLQIRRESN